MTRLNYGLTLIFRLICIKDVSSRKVSIQAFSYS